MTDGQLILVAGALLAAALGAALLAGRIRVPGLLLFLGLGMLVGTDGLGWIDLSDYELARRIGIIALAAILFEGGLTAGFREIRPVLRPGLMLAVVGTLVTAAITGLAGAWLLGLTTLEGLLLGSILSVTDGAAIFALLRTSTLRRRLARTLEAEAGFNDPVAILLVIGFIEWIQQPDYGLIDMVALFARQISIGLAAGLAVGFAAVWAFRRVGFATGGLYPVASIAAGALPRGLSFRCRRPSSRASAAGASVASPPSWSSPSARRSTRRGPGTCAITRSCWRAGTGGWAPGTTRLSR